MEAVNARRRIVALSPGDGEALTDLARALGALAAAEVRAGAEERLEQATRMLQEALARLAAVAARHPT